ncbi:MAG: DNA primase large subunit PriL [Candidatus Bathyarchaeia archaeon]
MLSSRQEYAKYPFIQGASEYVKALDLRLEELDSPEYLGVIERAEQRVEESLVDGKVAWRKGQAEDVEILSFPVAMAFVASIGDSFLKRRYCLAEAKRTYELLKQEDDIKVVNIASTCMGWRAKLSPYKLGRPSVITLNFIDYLRNAARFHEDRWKLVNRKLCDGEVLLRKEELARLIAEEVRTRFERMLEQSPKAELPPFFDQRVQKIVHLLNERKEKLKMDGMPKKVIVDAFPPCIRRLNDALLSGQHIPHVGRFTLTSFLLNIGREVDELLKLYTSISDVDESFTRYQIEHIAGYRGSGTRYSPPNCRSLQTHSLCTDPDDLCKNIRHPLKYYFRKANALQRRGNETSY